MGLFTGIRMVITIAIMVGVLAASVIAFADAARVPSFAYTSNGKRTKKFWLLVLGAGLLFALMGAVQMIGIMLNIIAIVPAAAYWYGVRPEIKPQRVNYQRSVSVLNNSFTPADHSFNSNQRERRPAGNPNDPRFDV